MARLTAAERARQGAMMLDKRWPRSEHGFWFLEKNTGDITNLCVLDLHSYSGLGKIFFWALRQKPNGDIEEKSHRIPKVIMGLRDQVAESHGFVVPSFDAETHEDYSKKREEFDAKLSQAWREEILKRRRQK